VFVENLCGDGPLHCRSHFGEGVLTFQMPFLFKTPDGWNLMSAVLQTVRKMESQLWMALLKQTGLIQHSRWTGALRSRPSARASLRAGTNLQARTPAKTKTTLHSKTFRDVGFRVGWSGSNEKKANYRSKLLW